MNIELRYFDGCPNWRVADERVREALSRVGMPDVNVSYVRIETIEQADALGFVGSPTVLVDGHDPFATSDDHVGLACRMFRTPTGLAGSPTVAEFEEAFT